MRAAEDEGVDAVVEQRLPDIAAMISSVIGVSSQPSSMSGTSSGQALADDAHVRIEGRDGAFVGAAGDGGAGADDADLAVRVAATAACAPGSMTPVTGTGSVSSRRGSARAEAVLQATTMVLACSRQEQRRRSRGCNARPWSRSCRRRERARCRRGRR